MTTVSYTFFRRHVKYVLAHGNLVAHSGSCVQVGCQIFLTWQFLHVSTRKQLISPSFFSSWASWPRRLRANRLIAVLLT